MLKVKHKLISSLVVASGGAVMFCSIALWKNDQRFYRSVVMPLVHRLEPETSHRLAVVTAKWTPSLLLHLLTSAKHKDDEILKTKVWNLTFDNPIGLAAGFDKHGEAVSGLYALGFGFVEVGSVTPQPQQGNPKPRVFRLTMDKAVINRYGFNSDGHEAVKKRLEGVVKKGGVLGVNLGQNKTSTQAWSDYVRGVESFGSVADFMVVNISSPNTPGLRRLQQRQALEEVIDKVLEARNTLDKTHVPILIKIAPDLNVDELKDIAHVVMAKKVDGIVICNTTVTRPQSLTSTSRAEVGGLSGEPLRHMSTEVIRQVYNLTKGSVPIIGVGGVQSGQDAYDKIRAGASLIEIYTVLVYEGPPVVDRIKVELTNLLRNDGFSSVSEAVGAEHTAAKLK